MVVIFAAKYFNALFEMGNFARLHCDDQKCAQCHLEGIGDIIAADPHFDRVPNVLNITK